jgi:vacuolar-type H+-ATPase subunit F/Vma7
MAKICVVGKKTFTIGFRLAGIRNIVWTDGMDKKQISEKLKELTSNPEIGMIIVEGEEFEKLDLREREYFESLTYPIIVPFSSTFKSETLLKKIIQTIGIDLMG